MYKVYLLRTDDGEQRYKIGYTKRQVEKRIKEFKTGNSSDFEIVDVFESKYGSKIEASLKNMYKHYNISGEWFILPDSEVIKFNSTCELIHQNLELLANNNTWIIDRNML